MNNRIISKEEIESILTKYNIGKKPLSIVLGWGEVTIIRYLDGKIPDQFHSNILIKIKDDYYELLKYLNKNKNLISHIAYQKTNNKIKEIINNEDRKKIYLIAKHIMAKLEDTTPLTIQKILYFIDGFTLALLSTKAFHETCEIDTNGLIYKEIKEYLDNIKYAPIEKNNFHQYVTLKLNNQKQVKIIDEVIKNFGCYSSKTLEKMQKLTMPLQQDSKLPSKILSKEELKLHFQNICQKYHVNSIDDISKYSKILFRKVVK